ncbi:hypothetical protein [Propionivibrio sp.]|uniref:hypothetical protein n=1 Tax=Propionivibrio sp. TaxID=2212460 RepID=UPI0026212896|nr:hypothetical protein [Propionivibrio sp.]
MMIEPTKLRTNLLRLLYLVMAMGLAVTVWPAILIHQTEQVHAATGAQSMMAAMGALAVIGLWFPLRMLLLLVFEVFWKLIFLLSFALPLLLNGEPDSASWENIWACLIAMAFIPIIPWRYWLQSISKNPS